MTETAPRTTKFLVELIGDLETVTDICWRCPDTISLEEHFTGWEPSAKPTVQVFLVARQDLTADAAASLLARILEDIRDRPPRSDRTMQMRTIVGNDAEMSHIKNYFQNLDGCSWAEFRFTSAPGADIEVKTTNMSALLKRAVASSRGTNK